MVRIYSIFIFITFLTGYEVYAEEVKLQHEDLTLNANLEKADDWPVAPAVLITHGTLSHNKSEIIVALQELFLQHGVSSLAINLALGLNDRHGSYDCNTPHNHKHEEAISEIGLWLDWIEEQGVNQVVLLGHSRGGNQTAWFVAEHDDPLIKKVILIAPQTWNQEYEMQSYEKNYGKPLATVLGNAESLVAAGAPETAIEHTDFIYCKDTTVSAEAVVSYYAADPRKDTTYLLPKIKKPVLVFAGSEDQTVKGLNEKLAPLAEAGGIELVVIDGADHFFRDLYVEDLVDSAMEFINE